MASTKANEQGILKSSHVTFAASSSGSSKNNSSENTFRTSYNKLPRLKEGGAYFKERGIIHLKFQNFVIFLLKVTKNNYNNVIYYYLF